MSKMSKLEAEEYAKSINKGLPKWCPPITAGEASCIPLLRIRDITDPNSPEFEVMPAGYLREVAE